MDEDVIDDIAAAFLERLSESGPNTHYGTILADIETMAYVIQSHNETYDLRYFYRNAGYPAPFPIHEMR